MTDYLEKIENPEISYKSILNAMFDDLAIVDRNGIMIYVTEGFEQNYKVRKADVLGKTVEELEKNYTFNPSVARKVFENNGPVIMSHSNRDGNYVIVKGVPIYDERGQIKYVASYVVNSYEIKSLQQERERLTEKLEEYQRALAKLQDQYDTMKQGLTDLSGSRNVVEAINKIKQYDVSVLFMGESGVGKTTFARYLHENGSRADGPFVEISCGAIPENLLESELFGYEKGSFTGANKEGKVGLIETANGGTLFLDEIGELPLKLQAKLLKVLQEKTLMRIGGTTEIQVDFRLITATNKDLQQMVEERAFREDLFYRINVITIDIPPLRKRHDDTVTFIKYFLDKYNLKYGEKKSLNTESMRILSKYRWPGNIREMENTIERLIIMSEGDVITVEDLPGQIFRDGFDKLEAVESGKDFNTLIKEYESFIINKAVQRYKTSVQVAKHLGISQPTAARKIKEYVTDK